MPTSTSSAIATGVLPPADAAQPVRIAQASVAGVKVPDTPLISRALEYARQYSEPYLFNHVMRSWLFAASIAQRDQVAHDAEVLAVATLLHDLGLSEAFAGPLRFEVQGANAVRTFVEGQGVDGRRAQLIWDSVALNSTPSLALYKEVEVSLCTRGIALDWGGWGYESLPRSKVAEIVEAFPRLEMKRRFARAVCQLVETRPATTYDNFARDFGERFVTGYKPPSTVDLLMSAPFPE